MRDAKEISNVRFEYNGFDIERTETFITCNGEVYIGLYHQGRCVNIRGTDIHRYIKKTKENGEPVQLPRIPE